MSLAWPCGVRNITCVRVEPTIAVFLASIAALFKLTTIRATDNEWQHGQVQTELNRQLIMRKKLLPSELGRIPMDLIELRHLADYKPQSVTAREAKRPYHRADRFLAAIKKALERQYEQKD